MNAGPEDNGNKTMAGQFAAKLKDPIDVSALYALSEDELREQARKVVEGSRDGEDFTIATTFPTIGAQTCTNGCLDMRGGDADTGTDT